MCSPPFRPISGQNSNGDSLGSFCGSFGPNIESTGRYMYLQYHVDGRESGTGFAITYRKLQLQMRQNFAKSVSGLGHG